MSPDRVTNCRRRLGDMPGDSTATGRQIVPSVDEPLPSVTACVDRSLWDDLRHMPFSIMRATAATTTTPITEPTIVNNNRTALYWLISASGGFMFPPDGLSVDVTHDEDVSVDESPLRIVVVDWNDPARHACWLLSKNSKFGGIADIGASGICWGQKRG